MTEARAWLPKDAFEGVAGKEALAAPIAAWASHWFTRARVGVSRVRAGDAGCTTSSASGFDLAGQLATLELSGSGRRHLLETLLDVDLAEHARNESDGHLLDAFVAEVLEDLLRRVDDVLDDAVASSPEPQIRYQIAVGRNDLLEVVVPAGALAPLVKAQMVCRSGRLPALTNRQRALCRTQVTARAILGHAELSLSDVKELNVGDVLVLDRSIHESVELRVRGGEQAFAEGKLRQNGERISIQL